MDATIRTGTGTGTARITADDAKVLCQDHADDELKIPKLSKRQSGPG